MREIRINKALNGYIVNVGCQTLVFTDIGEVCTELTRYAAEPEKVEKEYLHRYGVDVPAPPVRPCDEHRLHRLDRPGYGFQDTLGTACETNRA